MIKSILIFSSFLSSHKISLCRKEIQRVKGKNIIDRYLGICVPNFVWYLYWNFVMSYTSLTVETRTDIPSKHSQSTADWRMPTHSNPLKNIHVTTLMQNIYGFLFTNVYEIGEAILYFQFLKLTFNLSVPFGLYILLLNVLCALHTNLRKYRVAESAIQKSGHKTIESRENKIYDYMQILSHCYC